MEHELSSASAVALSLRCNALTLGLCSLTVFSPLNGMPVSKYLSYTPADSPYYTRPS